MWTTPECRHVPVLPGRQSPAERGFRPGNLEHPIWGIRYCYLTGLEMTQEPKDNYVSYRFTFTGAQTNGVVPR